MKMLRFGLEVRLRKNDDESVRLFGSRQNGGGWVPKQGNRMLSGMVQCLLSLLENQARHNASIEPVSPN